MGDDKKKGFVVEKPEGMSRMLGASASEVRRDLMGQPQPAAAHQDFIKFLFS